MIAQRRSICQLLGNCVVATMGGNGPVSRNRFLIAAIRSGPYRNPVPGKINLRRAVACPPRRANGANGMSDIEGKVAREAMSECGQRASFNGVNGMSDIEGSESDVH